MKSLTHSIVPILLCTVLAACHKDQDIDTQKPEIDLSAADAFPVMCDTLYFGETCTLKVLLTDNAELGSKQAFSIDIHNNFNHHSHSTEVEECSANPIKEPINPFSMIQDFAIPEGLGRYETNFSITIPDGNANGQFDEGDYHFYISLTDQSGWSVQKGLSIKMLRRTEPAPL